MNLNRPASDLYYPSMVVHLGLRFDETLMVVTDDRYYDSAQTKQAANMQDPPQESPYLQPLVVPGARVSQVLNRIPIKASVELPGIRQAGKFDLTFDYRVLPIDPRLMSAITVEIHLGAVAAGDFSDGIGGVTWGDAGGGGQVRSVLRTRDAAGIPDNDSLLMIGTCDMNECSFDGQGTVHLEGRDLRGLLLDGKIPPKDIEKINLQQPISKVVGDILETITIDHTVKIDVKPIGFVGDKEPSPADSGGLTRCRMGADGDGAKSQPAGGDKLSYWDLITNYCFLVGAVPYFVGQTLYIRPARDIYSQISGDQMTPFAGGTAREVMTQGLSGPTTEKLRVRRLVYGRNIESLSYQRKYGGVKVPIVEVVGIDDTVRGDQKLLVEQWPPIDSDAAKSKGENDKIRSPIHGIRSREQMRAIAQDLYEEIGRGEIGGTCKTKVMASFGGDNEDPDMIRLRPTDAVELTVDVRAISSRAPLVSELTEQNRRPFDEQVKVLADMFGDVNLARALVATQRSSIVDGLRWFRTSNVKFDWDGSKSGIAISFDFQNYIVARHGASAAAQPAVKSVTRTVSKTAAKAIPPRGTGAAAAATPGNAAAAQAAVKHAGDTAMDIARGQVDAGYWTPYNSALKDANETTGVPEAWIQYDAGGAAEDSIQKAVEQSRKRP